VGLALLALLLAADARAHTRSVSYSSWTLEPDGARVELRIPLLELTRLGEDAATEIGTGGPVARYLSEQLTLTRGGARCAPEGEVAAAPAPKGWAHFRWRVRCDASGSAVIASHILLAEAPSHLHFARVAGASVQERVLTEAAPSWPLPADGTGTASAAPTLEGTGLGGYVALGIEHILSGTDHLAFVLALLLLASRLSEVAALVTAFTLAHSLTLALAVLHVLNPDAAAVDALIGLSIALVAAENAWLLGGRGRALPWLASVGLLALAVLAAVGVGTVPALALCGLALFTACHFALLRRVERPARLRAAVAFTFGLVHGFGFAGVLAEMQLPTERVLHALFGFNAGVELGQLAIVALVWPALRALQGSSPDRLHRRVAELGSAAICGLGLYWFLLRTFA